MEDKTNSSLLVEGCLRGNQRSEKKLFELYYGFVMNICYRYSNSLENTQEMANDTFYKAFKYLKSYDRNYAFTAWLKRIATNCCIDHYHKYEDKFRTSQLTDHNIQYTEDLEDESLGSFYVECIRQLPPAYKTVFNLYVFEEYTHAEIAKKLDISIGTSKSNLSRAKEKLRQIIDSKEENTSKDIADG